MKRIFDRITFRLLLAVFSFVSAFGIYSCKTEEENFTIVDLRYNPEDSYLLDASSPDEIAFEVKSNYPWEVYGNNDWYTIAPSSGKADSIYEVTIRATENTILDDRLDTVTIKSDYWIGKQFTITQKGIAMLDVNHGNDTLLNSGIDQKTFAVISNQDWSCEVTEGSEWLSIASGSTGTLNGEVTVETKRNKGELRYGVVTVSDRHQVPSATVTFSQEGVLLIPEKLELREDYNEHEVIFEVESNTEWEIEKSEWDVWFQITSGTTYSGNATVKIQLNANSSVSLRKAEITLKTKSDDPSVNPVVKSVILKQAPEPVFEHYEFGSGDFPSYGICNGSPTFENGDMICDGKDRIQMTNIKLGTHTFRLKQAESGLPVWYTCNWPIEVRYHVNATGGSTGISFTNTVGAELIGSNVSIDLTKAHSLTLKISEEDSNLRFDFILDGEQIAYTNTILPTDTPIPFIMGSNSGKCVWDWYEYAPLVDWDN